MLRDWGEGWCTLRRFMLSRRWRGTTVTSSDSQRKATSAGVRPGPRGAAIGRLRDYAGTRECLVNLGFNLGNDELAMRSVD